MAALIAARRPTPLQTQGLMAALRDMVLMWSRQSDIEVDLQLPDACSLPLPVEDALWWVAQEALSNVARHSQASLVHLGLNGMRSRYDYVSLTTDLASIQQSTHKRAWDCAPCGSAWPTLAAPCASTVS